MAERRLGREISGPEATGDGSRGIAAFLARSGAALRGSDPLAVVTGIVGAAAAVLLVIAEFSTIVSVTTLTATCEDLANSKLQDHCLTTGGEQHSYALLLLAVLVALMTWGTVAGASRPAAFALVAMGIVVIVIAVALDVPDTNDEGLIGINFEEAHASPGAGLWIELVAGALAFSAGVLGLLEARRPRRATA